MVISCELARPGVRRGAAEASGSGGVQHVLGSVGGVLAVFHLKQPPMLFLCATLTDSLSYDFRKVT